MIRSSNTISGSYISDATLFPQEINIAATFNREHAFNMGEITAYEARAALNPWSFSPTLDLGRDPRWARLWDLKKCIVSEARHTQCSGDNFYVSDSAAVI